MIFGMPVSLCQWSSGGSDLVASEIVCSSIASEHLGLQYFGRALFSGTSRGRSRQESGGSGSAFKSPFDRDTVLGRRGTFTR